MRLQRMIRQAEHAQRVKSSHAFAALLPFSKLGENEGTNNISDPPVPYRNVLIMLTFKSIFLLQNLHTVAWSYEIPGIAQL